MPIISIYIIVFIMIISFSLIEIVSYKSISNEYKDNLVYDKKLNAVNNKIKREIGKGCIQSYNIYCVNEKVGYNNYIEEDTFDKVIKKLINEKNYKYKIMTFKIDKKKIMYVLSQKDIVQIIHT